MSALSLQGIQNSAAYPSAPEIHCVQKQQALADAAGGAAQKQASPVYDEYIPEEKDTHRSAGLYQVVHEEDGSPRIQFDAPAEGPEAPGREVERCTVNTDSVDRELSALNEEKQRLEQQIRSEEDPQRAEELEKQLAAVEQELRQKDNDAYRRQNAVFS